MSRPRLFLHVGIDKTGTTAIQNALFANAELLADEGFAVVESNRMREYQAKHRLRWRQRGDASWAALEREAKKISKSGRSAIISNESLWMEPPEVFRTFGQAFPDHEPVVVVYVREQAEHLQSRALQRQKSAAKAWNLLDPEAFAAFARRPLQHLGFDQTFAGYEHALGAGCVRVRLYDRSNLVGGDVVLDFFDALGLGHRLDDVVRIDEPNQSLTVEMALVLQELVEQVPDDLKWGEVRDAARRLSAAGVGGRYFLTRAEVDEIRARFRAGNERLFERYLPGVESFRERDVWRLDGPVDLDSYRERVLDTARELPMLRAAGWNGNRRLGGRIFGDVFGQGTMTGTHTGSPVRVSTMSDADRARRTVSLYCPGHRPRIRRTFWSVDAVTAKRARISDPLVRIASCDAMSREMSERGRSTSRASWPFARTYRKRTSRSGPGAGCRSPSPVCGARISRKAANTFRVRPSHHVARTS